MVPFGDSIREKRHTTKEDKFLEDKESKKIYAVLRETKRGSSLKEPSLSTWEEFCFLEVDSLERIG
jgi:hypothetical protein